MGYTHYKENDYDLNVLLEEHKFDYLEEKQHVRIEKMTSAYDLLDYDMDDEDKINHVASCIYYGGHWDGDMLQTDEKFRYFDDYIIEFDGGWFSSSKENLEIFINRFIDEEEFIEWCKYWDYIEPEEVENEEY